MNIPSALALNLQEITQTRQKPEMLFVNATKIGSCLSFFIFLLVVTLGLEAYHSLVSFPYVLAVVSIWLLAIGLWSRRGLFGGCIGFVVCAWWLLRGDYTFLERFWQVGLLGAFSLNSWIFLLILEELQDTLSSFNQQVKHCAIHLEKIETTANQDTVEWAKERVEFEEEIKRLKEAEKLRRIEQEVELKRTLLIQTEIDMLTQQKAEWLSAAQSSRTLATERLYLLEEAQKQIEHLNVQNAQSSPNNLENWNFGCTQVPRMNEDQRPHISNIGSFVIAQSRELSRPPTSNSSDCLDIKHPAVEDVSITQIQEQKQEECIDEPATTSPSLAESLQGCLQKVVEEPSEELITWKRKCAQAEGLYKQLRTQFDEKARTLSQTRKELFRVQGQWMALSHAHALEGYAAPCEEIVILGCERNELMKTLQSLEEEVRDLEELVSHILLL